VARDFNGTNQALEFAGTPVTAVPLTLACWFLYDAGNLKRHLIALDESGANGHVALYAANGSTLVIEAEALNAAGSAGRADTSTTFSTGAWNHACAVFTSATSRAAFLNGGGKGTNATSISATPGLTRIGCRVIAGSNVGNFMDGKIAEAAVWNVALADDEVLMLARGFSPLLVRRKSLVAYWPILGRLSPEIDLVGNRGLTLTSAPPQYEHPRVFYPVGPRSALPVGAAAHYTLAAAAGTFTETGQAAGLVVARKVAAGVGAFVLAGQSAGVKVGRVIPASAGTFTLSGQVAGLRSVRLLPAAVGAFVVGGQAAAFATGHGLTAGAGVFVVSGQVAAFRTGRGLAAAAGAFTLSGQPARPTAVRGLPAAGGAFVVSGAAAGLRAARGLGAAPGAFALTGQTAGLTAGRSLPAAPGAFDVSGVPAGLVLARGVLAGVGTFDVTGQDAALVYSQAAQPSEVADDVRFTYSQADAPEFAVAQADGAEFEYIHADGITFQGAQADRAAFNYTQADEVDF
jgi:hypothetical protein